MEQPGASDRPAGGLAYKWVVMINTTIGILMAAMDSSIVTVALPQIAHQLDASVAETMWVVMGFQLVITALLMPFARLADMKGRVGPYNVGFAVFTLASILCGFSQTGLQLVLFRLLQGVGAALLFANSTALLTDAFPSSERGFALGMNQMVGVSGFILGTVLGGVVTELLGWRYIFFLNIPFGVFGTLWAYLRLHEIVEPERRARFDLGGMLTFPLGIASVLCGLTFVVMGRAGEPITAGLVVVGLALLVLFVAIERRVLHPMIDLTLFRVRLFWACNASLLLNALARGSTGFVMSWYFQAVLHDSPLIAGLKLIPMVSTMVLLAPVAGRLSDRFGSRWLATLGLTFTLLAQLWMITFPVDVPYPTLGIALAVLGVGNGLFNSPNTSALMGSVPSNRRGVAAGMRTLLNNTGQTTAVAAAMVVLSTVMSYQVLSALFGSGGGETALEAQLFMRGFHEVFLVSAAISAVAIVLSSLRGAEGAGVAAARPAPAA